MNVSTHRGLNGRIRATSQRIMKKRRFVTKCLVISVVMLFMFASIENTSFELYRQLQAKVNEAHEIGRSLGKYQYCRTPYVLMQHLMMTMPDVIPPKDRMNPPSHVQLCEAYLHRKDLGQSQLEALPAVRVFEDPAVCLDWSAPHHSIMTMFASSLIAAKGLNYGLRYTHDCHKFIPHTRESAHTHYDYTTVQEVLTENLISEQNADAVDDKILENLCHGCISYDEQSNPSTMAGMTHHCFLFPGGASAQSLIDERHELPLTTILPSFIDRLRHLTEDWFLATDALEFERESGVIIGLDEKSTFMDLSFYDKAIISPPSSIQILASANCAMAHLKGASDCIEHGRALKAHFKARWPLPTYVRYDIVASTATSFTRMMAVKTLVCPPGTVMCLIPAIGKAAGRKAVIAEDGSRPATFHWFDSLIEKRKALGFQQIGYDAVADEDYLIISEEISSDLPKDLPLDELDGDNHNVVFDQATHAFSHVEDVDVALRVSKDSSYALGESQRDNYTPPVPLTKPPTLPPTQFTPLLGPEEVFLNSIEVVYDFTHLYFSYRSFHLGDAWTGEVQGKPQYIVSSIQVEGTEPALIFWNDERREFTTHMGEAWRDEIKSEERSESVFYAFPDSVNGLALEPVYVFWNEGENCHSFHTGKPWPGEGETDQIAFYAFPFDEKYLIESSKNVTGNEVSANSTSDEISEDEIELAVQSMGNSDEDMMY